VLASTTGWASPWAAAIPLYLGHEQQSNETHQEEDEEYPNELRRKHGDGKLGARLADPAKLRGRLVQVGEDQGAENETYPSYQSEAHGGTAGRDPVPYRQRQYDSAYGERSHDESDCERAALVPHSRGERESQAIPEARAQAEGHAVAEQEGCVGRPQPEQEVSSSDKAEGDRGKERSAKPGEHACMDHHAERERAKGQRGDEAEGAAAGAQSRLSRALRSET
jgi:hypothetical protein